MQGKKLVFVTNNSTKSRAGYLNKFKKLGLNVTAVGVAPCMPTGTCASRHAADCLILLSCYSAVKRDRNCAAVMLLIDMSVACMLAGRNLLIFVCSCSILGVHQVPKRQKGQAHLLSSSSPHQLSFHVALSECFSTARQQHKQGYTSAACTED